MIFKNALSLTEKQLVPVTNEGQRDDGRAQDNRRVRAETADWFSLPALKPLDQILSELPHFPTGLVKDSSKLIINGEGEGERERERERECTVLSLT